MHWRLKPFLPQSLFGRAMLIILAPVALMQIAVTWAFFEAHWETVTSRLSESVAGDVAVVVDLYRQRPGAARVAEIDPFLRRTLGLAVALEPGARLPTATRSSFFRVLDRTLGRALGAKLEPGSFWFDTTRYPAYVDIQVQVDDGVLRIIVPRDQVFATTGHIFILWITLATVALMLVSLVYIRNQTKPLERLADAAERFGRGHETPPFKPAGSSEVRKAAEAFIDMRERIQRQIEQRTTLLAGVSHDLRTPLTRLKLQLALMEPSEEREAMSNDLADMESVLEEYLAFARGVGGEEAQPVELGPLVRKVADGLAGAKIDAALEDGLVLIARAGALRRCLENLVGNAAAHAEHVKLTARRDGASLVIDIDDDGPGIPEALREEVFKPFNRLDAARTRNKKGVGLGLAIARDIARGHGGDITLCDSPLGGLRARVRLPV